MAQINLTSEDLTDLSRLMIKWRDEMKALNNKLTNQIKTMDGWRDPQFQMFLNAIEMTSSQLNTYIKNMEHMGKSLKMYADQQKEINSQFRSQMGSIR